MLKFVTGCCAGLAMFTMMVSVYRSSLSSHTPSSVEVNRFSEIAAESVLGEKPNVLAPQQFTAVRSPGSNSVRIQYAQQSEALWYVVHMRDVEVDAIYGARLFKTIETEGDILLLTANTGTGKFVIVRYRDNGDRIFSPTLDKPLTDVDTGGILMTSVR
jgi:hypothetical protein